LLVFITKVGVVVVANLHRSIRKCPNGILLNERVSNLLNGIEVELVGKVSADCISLWRVFGRFADVIDLVKFFCRDFYVSSEIYRKLFIEAANDKIKQMFLSYPVVCFGRLNILSKQTLLLTRCDRLTIDYHDHRDFYN